MKKRQEGLGIDVFSYSFMVIFSLFCIMPFILILSSSITAEKELVYSGFSLIPKQISFLAYQLILQDNLIFYGYRTTIIITVMGTLLCLLITSAMAYSLSVKTFVHRNKIAFFIYFSMLFNAGLVPNYLLISKYLHMKDTIWVFMIPVLINPFNMFLLRNFFSAIPDSLAESAKIDGANDIYILFKIILPLSKPAIATIGLFYALGFWNAWFECTLYITDKSLYTLQYIVMKVLRDIDFAKQAAQMGVNLSWDTGVLLPSNGAKMATAVVTVGPIIFAYPFVQKYFVKGLVVGAVKG